MALLNNTLPMEGSLSTPDLILNGLFSLDATSWPACAFLGLVSWLFVTLYRTSRVSLDSREPQLLRSRVPLVGHIFSMLHKGGAYYVSLYNKSRSLSAATLSIFGHKVYVIFSPTLAQAALRNRDLSFDPFIVLASDALVNLSPQALEMCKNGTLIAAYTGGLPSATAAGPMRHMAANGLASIAGQLEILGTQIQSSGGQGLTISNLHHYLRTVIALATSDSLYGKETNPMRANQSLIDDIWIFQDALPYLTPNVLPWLLAPAGNRARSRIQNAFIEYYRRYPYEKSFPEDAAEMTRMRGRILRGLGFDDVDVGRIEITMIFAATVNNAPMIFWFVANVFARPSVLERVRAEVLPLVETEPIFDSASNDGQKEPRRRATLRASLLIDESRCPYLAAVHRETLRLCNSQTGTRHVMRDTTLPDGTLLRAGATVHMPTAVTHRLSEVWGSVDPAEFEPARWFAPGVAGSRRPAAYFPFGGGKHLCPGRNFAYAENASLLAALAVGFQVTGLTQDNLPPCAVANLMGESVPNPGQNVGVHIRRRKGWEEVSWNLVY